MPDVDERTNAAAEAFAKPLDVSEVDELQLAELVIGLRILHPDWHYQKITAALRAVGVKCTMGQVKRVKFGAAHSCELEANKATQQLVDVNTKMGKAVIKVPGSAKAVLASMQKMEWLDADRAALDAILVLGNQLVPITQVPEGTPIAPCVTARRLKKDQATGEIEKLKSRHAIDGKRLSIFRAKLGLPPEPRGTSNIIDDLDRWFSTPATIIQVSGTLDILWIYFKIDHSLTNRF